MTQTAPRRTQAQRREATIAKLLEATVGCLVEHGYRDTSIGRICEAAGVSHGGLFRHFPTRTALIAAATDEIGRRHLRVLEGLAAAPEGEGDMVEALVRFFRQATRDPRTAAWREVLVAARTDAALRADVAPAVQAFEDAVMQVAAGLSGAPVGRARELGTLVLSLLHMFDSEAISSAILVTEDVERMRHAWAAGLLRDALRR